MNRSESSALQSVLDKEDYKHTAKIAKNKNIQKKRNLIHQHGQYREIKSFMSWHHSKLLIQQGKDTQCCTTCLCLVRPVTSA